MNDMNMGPPQRRDPGRAVSTITSATPDRPGFQPYPAPEGGGPTLGGIASKLRRQSRLILGVFLAVTAAGVGLTMMQPKVYTATALLMINPNPDQIVPEKQISTARSDAATVDSEIEILKSPWLAARLAGELKLDRDPEFIAAGAKLANANTQAAPVVTADVAHVTDEAVDPSAAELISTGADDGLPSLPPPPERPEPPKVADEVVAAVTDAIDIRRRGLSYVVEVSTKSGSPERAAEMANGLSNIYLKSLAEARYDSSEKANVWLRDRLGELKREVQRKQADAQAYRAQRNLLTVQGASLVEQQVAQVQAALLRTKAEYAQKQAQSQMISDISDAGSTVSGSGDTNDAMRDLRAKQAEVSQRVADMQNRYGPSYPALLQALDEKAALDKRVTEEMARTAANAKVESSALAARMNAEERELEGLRGQLVSGNFDQVRLDALETDATATQSVYEGFLQRYQEVARQGTATGVGARLVSPARAPADPTSPHMLLNGALSVAVGVILGLLAGLIAEQMRGAVETTDEVEQRVGARALVAIPRLRRRDLRNIPKANRAPTGYLLAKRMSPFAEAFRVLQASILLANQPQRNVAAITSAMPGEGKTTLSMGLARVAAMGGQKAIVVDCDIRMRAINKLLGIDPKEGLQEVLSGARNWRDVVGCDQASGAHVLPASSLTSKDIFGTGAMEDLIRQLAAEYDLVVLDCAPVFAVAETRVIASLADSVVVAARSGKTPARALQAAISQLEIAGANVLGVALNRVDMRRGRRSFYDGLYYSKAFSGYYTKA